VPSTELTTKYDIGKGTVLRLLDDAGVIRAQHRLTMGQLEEAGTLYVQGWSLSRLGEHFGFDQATIWNGLKRKGVTMRKPWERLS
jgi:hypothetical protein